MAARSARAAAGDAGDWVSQPQSTEVDYKNVTVPFLQNLIA